MGRKFVGLLFIFVFAGARLLSTAQEPAGRGLPVIWPALQNPSWPPAAAMWMTARSALPPSRPASRRAMPWPRCRPSTPRWWSSWTPKIAPAWPSRCIPRSLSAMPPRLANRKSAACSPTSRSIKTCTRCWRRSMAPGSILPAAITCGPLCATTIAPALTATIPPGRKYGRCRTNW